MPPPGTSAACAVHTSKAVGRLAASEFHEMCQSETPENYRRLLGGDAPSDGSEAGVVATPNPVSDELGAEEPDEMSMWDLEGPSRKA